jgi:hypothetical protein
MIVLKDVLPYTYFSANFMARSTQFKFKSIDLKAA